MPSSRIYAHLVILAHQYQISKTIGFYSVYNAKLKTNTNEWLLSDHKNLIDAENMLLSDTHFLHGTIILAL